MSVLKIRVLLVEDFPLVREGVAAALQRDPAIVVVGEAANGREGLQLAHELRPDVVLLDLHMPELGGMMLLERIRAELPGARTIVMTASEKARAAARRGRGGRLRLPHEARQRRGAAPGGPHRPRRRLGHRARARGPPAARVLARLQRREPRGPLEAHAPPSTRCCASSPRA